MRWRGGGWQARAVGKLPLWVRRAPLDAVFAIGTAPTTLLMVAGPAQSRALSQIIPNWGYRMWAGLFLVGCLFWIIGLSSIKETPDGRTIITRMPSLLFGLSLVPTCATVFGVAALLVGGWNGLLAAHFPLVLAFGTWLRKVDLATRYRLREDE